MSPQCVIVIVIMKKVVHEHVPTACLSLQKSELSESDGFLWYQSETYLSESFFHNICEFSTKILCAYFVLGDVHFTPDFKILFSYLKMRQRYARWCATIQWVLYFTLCVWVTLVDEWAPNAPDLNTAAYPLTVCCVYWFRSFTHFTHSLHHYTPVDLGWLATDCDQQN